MPLFPHRLEFDSSNSGGGGGGGVRF